MMETPKKTDHEIINKAIDSLMFLTKEDFHDYRSEIWAVLATVIKEARADFAVDPELIKGKLMMIACLSNCPECVEDTIRAIKQEVEKRG